MVFLKIFQDDTLTGNLASMDLATKTNLENLVKVGEDLLKKPVTRMNMVTRIREPCHHSSNEMALKKYTGYSHNLIIHLLYNRLNIFDFLC